MLRAKSRSERATGSVAEVARLWCVGTCPSKLWRVQLRFVEAYKLSILITAVTAGIPASAEFELTEVKSPNNQLVVMVSTRQPEPLSSRLEYEVAFQEKEKPIILRSELGIELTDGTYLGGDCEIVDVETRQIDASFEQYPGKRRLVTDRCTETTLTMREKGTPRLEWQLVVRAYDDGVALRYHFPEQTGSEKIRISREFTQWNFVDDARATALPLANFTTSHEGRYLQLPVAELPDDKLFDVPLLVEVPEVGWVAIAEANLTDYAGMYLKKATGASMFTCELSPRTDDPEVAVVADLPHSSPWRVLLIGERPEKFIESDLLLKLNAPSVIKDVSWIKPGKTTFPWWNGYHEEKVSFQPGVNTATAKHYIDFCAEHGVPYHSLDGFRDTAWYGGAIVPYEGDDITTAVAGLDLPAVLEHAKQKGVRLRLWMHWQGAEKHMDRAFPLFHQWGIEGVMIDFMDRNDQEMVRFQHKLLQLAADNQLTVNFHGVGAPTGLERTYPNLLNSEAVMNLEYDKWDEQGIPPEHDLIVAQIRMLAGPMDYHQGSLRGVPLADFKPREVAPLVMGTPCRMLATYAVIQNHLPMMADYPTAYRVHPLTKIIAEIPTTWDDTRVLSGKLGEHLVIARRAGDDWWIGAMTDRKVRELTIPLEFLDGDSYVAVLYQDDLAADHRYVRHSQIVTSADQLSVALAEAGGALVHLRKKDPEHRTGWRRVWSDDFDTFDEDKWLRRSTNAKIKVMDGSLRIPAEHAMNSRERVGLVTSTFAQRFGRWEVRAKVPSATELRSAIRLLPDAPWPSLGEIDILTHDGILPTVTKSDFHWGTAEPFTHDVRSIAQRTSADGRLVFCSEDFHTYAAEWVKDQLRFFVDDVYHTVFYNDEVGYFLPRLRGPMRLSFDVMIDGQSPESVLTLDPSHDLVIDWVRVYEPDEAPGAHLFRNGSFEAGGGSLAGWHVFGNRLNSAPNIEVDSRHRKAGKWSLALSGQSTGDENHSGVTQGISVSGGQQVRACLSALVSSADSLAGSRNQASMKIEFYNNWGDYFGGPSMLGFEELTIADADTQPNRWSEHQLIATAPPGAVEARLSIVFSQFGRDGGAAHIDNSSFVVSQE